MKLDAGHRRFLDQQRAAGRVRFSTTTPAAVRAALEALAEAGPNGPAVADVTELVVGGTDGVPVRVYTPTGAVGTLLFLHGGGWLAGSIRSYDRLCRELAVRSSLRLISVDYRLAPAHRFPAAHDDAAAVAIWALDRFGGGPIGVGGDSAGGNLAAACAATRHNGRSFSFQALVYPVLDADFSRPSFTLDIPAPAVDGSDLEWFWQQYAPDVESRIDHRLSPILGEAARFPPTRLVIAGIDPLRDACLDFARKLDRAGVPVDVDFYPHVAHGFLGLIDILPPSLQALQQLADWCRHHAGSISAD